MNCFERAAMSLPLFVCSSCSAIPNRRHLSISSSLPSFVKSVSLPKSCTSVLYSMWKTDLGDISPMPTGSPVAIGRVFPPTNLEMLAKAAQACYSYQLPLAALHALQLCLFLLVCSLCAGCISCAQVLCSPIRLDFHLSLPEQPHQLRSSSGVPLEVNNLLAFHTASMEHLLLYVFYVLLVFVHRFYSLDYLTRSSAPMRPLIIFRQ